MYCFNVYILLIFVTSRGITTTTTTPVSGSGSVTPTGVHSTTTTTTPVSGSGSVTPTGVHSTTTTTTTTPVSGSGSVTPTGVHSTTTTTTTTPVSGSGSVTPTGVHSTTTVKAAVQCNNFSCVNKSCIEQVIRNETCNTTGHCFVSRINGTTTGGCANNCTKSEERSCCRADRCNNYYTPTTTTSPNYNNSNSYRIRLNGYFIHVCVVLAFTKIFILT